MGKWMVLAFFALVALVGIVFAVCYASGGTLPAATVQLWLQQPYAPIPQGGEVIGFIYTLSEQPGTGEGSIIEAEGAGLPPAGLRPATPSDVLQATGLALGVFDPTAGQAYYAVPVGWPTRLLGEHALRATPPALPPPDIISETIQLDEGVVAARLPFVDLAKVVLFEVAGGQVVRVRVVADLGTDPPELGVDSINLEGS